MSEKQLNRDPIFKFSNGKKLIWKSKKIWGLIQAAWKVRKIILKKRNKKSTKSENKVDCHPFTVYFCRTKTTSQCKNDKKVKKLTDLIATMMLICSVNIGFTCRFVFSWMIVLNSFLSRFVST